MQVTNTQRASILIEALPYIQKYNNKIVVIKYGGNAMINGELQEAVMGDIVLLSLIGIRVVLVHGGGPDITDMMSRLGKKSEFVDGLRVTDKETADIVLMVLAGKVSKRLVSHIQQKGGSAIGLCGADGGMIKARQIDERLGYVGEIEKINTSPILDILEKGYIPVISTVGCDDEGNIYNINADTAAAMIAGELNAESLITMTDTPGILEDPADENSIISRINIKDVPALIESGCISGGMIPKANCCVEAVKRGVNRVFIIDGRSPHSILIETLTDEGIGTMFISGD
ncbi:MAG: acetylglutamate kinase [Caldicoprobacterales bacterium]|jgi:acetylglutamate kinase|nr:acetylglutamate kinase [Bacillota bacterium]NLH58563.1 acetylglutamate kinase [Clostridiales bacterium]